MPLPSVEDDNAYYQQNNMLRDLVNKDSIDDEKLMNKYRPWAEKQVTLARSTIPANAKILEVGSGYGWFVEIMDGLGYDITGIELSKEKCELVKRRAGIELHSVNLLDENLPDAWRGQYDVVCMFHLLEHLSDPIGFLKKTSELLKPGGILLLEVPNVHEHLKSLSPEYADFSYLRAHLSYFSPETLAFVLEETGFLNIAIKGTQLYSLENAVHWLREGKPYLEISQIDMPVGLEWVGDIYKQTLNAQMTAGFITASAQKPKNLA